MAITTNHGIRQMISAVLVTTCLVGWAQAANQTWTGAGGDARWSNSANWSGGQVPGPNDHATIPRESSIWIDQRICVKSLTLQDNPPGKTTTLVGGPSSGSRYVIIKAADTVYIGRGATIAGRDQPRFTTYLSGGSVFIDAGGTVTNRGVISGGDGSNNRPGNPHRGGKGGSVTITSGGDIDNSGGGTITGGWGADGDGGGGDAGDVKLKAKGTVKSGSVAGGLGGNGRNGATDGDDGDVIVNGKTQVSLQLGDSIVAATVSLTTDPGGFILMAGLGAHAIEGQNVYIDAGLAAPIDLTGNPPGIDVILASESICLFGDVLLDIGVALEMITQPDATVSLETCAPTCAGDPNWFDSFEFYFDDQPGGLHGVGGWKGWDNDPAFSAPVTYDQAYTAFRSVEIGGNADLVHEICSRHSTSGSLAMSFSAWQYIPGDFASGGAGQFDGTYFVLQNSYSDGGPHNPQDWSVQIQFDSNDGLMKVFHGDGVNTIDVPYDTDRWVKIQVDIDLESDWTEIYYDDELITEYTWTGGVLGDGGGALDIAIVDLYANGSSSVYYDDLQLEPINAKDTEIEQEAPDFRPIQPGGVERINR